MHEACNIYLFFIELSCLFPKGWGNETKCCFFNNSKNIKRGTTIEKDEVSFSACDCESGLKFIQVLMFISFHFISFLYYFISLLLSFCNSKNFRFLNKKNSGYFMFVFKCLWISMHFSDPFLVNLALVFNFAFDYYRCKLNAIKI